MGATSALLALAVVLAACGTSTHAPDAGPTTAGPPDVDEAAAAAWPEARLAEAERGWAARAEGTVSPSRVEAATVAASIAGWLAWRTDDAAAVARARRLLVGAARDPSIAGACGASLALARLEARDAGALEAAFLVAYATRARFVRGDDRGCREEAARIVGALGAHRPAPEVLSAIDADPSRAYGTPAEIAALRTPGAAADAPAPTPAPVVDPTAPPTLRALEVYGQDEPGARSVRVVLSLDRPVAFTTAEQAATDASPRRVRVTLPGVSVSDGVVAARDVGAAGLIALRRSDAAEGAVLELDLEAHAEIRTIALPDPVMILVDVISGAPLASPAEGERRPLVLLDPGHGGDDFGARAFGLREADITLDLARRVRDALRRRAPTLRVVLTRENGTFVSLEQRSAMANAVDADAFVSIHLNAAWDPVARGGITTFVLDTTNDRQAIALAARENGTSTAEVGGLERLLAGLERREQGAASRALAESVQRATLAAGRRFIPGMYDRGVRSAMFYVLVGAMMPAVLVEASFLTYEPEARLLGTESYRQGIANGIADGIARWAASL